MNSIEEKLWNYIDGTCTPDEHKAISMLIETDEVYRKKHEELLAFNSELSTVELDEPPMAFTYNVMEAIRTENARTPLKAAINPVIIKAITGFFVLSISLLLIIVLSSIHWSDISTGPSYSLQNDALKQFLSGPAMQGFLFLDMILLLFLFAKVLRRRVAVK